MHQQQDDNEMFGPGTDLSLSLAAILLIALTIGAIQYTSRIDELQEKLASTAVDSRSIQDHLAQLRLDKILLQSRVDSLEQRLAEGGNFKVATIHFPGADFQMNPVENLIDENKTLGLTRDVIREYQGYKSEFPYIFVIGHATDVDDPTAFDQSYQAKLRRNWNYAGRRAIKIASLLQESLDDEEKDRIIVTSTGEFDLKNPELPWAPENAWVEIVFGRDWKIPSRLNQE